MPASKLFRDAKRALDALEEKRVPRRLTSRFTGGDDPRLQRDRMTIIPWLDRTRRLDGARILEIGSGPGVSTVALAEQGARVCGLDVESPDEAIRRCADHGVEATFVTANAQDLARVIDQPVDWVIFWASLEHMTVDERLISIRDAWDLLGADGLLTVIETPNRLWVSDSHTSLLPYFNWLPDDLAFHYSRFSPRVGFNDRYREFDEVSALEFQRRGRGVSYHEFEVAIGTELPVISSLQLDLRARNPVRNAGWRCSEAGRFERRLRSASPDTPRAFLQPFLYLTLRKG